MKRLIANDFFPWKNRFQTRFHSYLSLRLFYIWLSNSPFLIEGKPMQDPSISYIPLHPTTNRERRWRFGLNLSITTPQESPGQCATVPGS